MLRIYIYICQVDCSFVDCYLEWYLAFALPTPVRHWGHGRGAISLSPTRQLEDISTMHHLLSHVVVFDISHSNTVVDLNNYLVALSSQLVLRFRHYQSANAGPRTLVLQTTWFRNKTESRCWEWSKPKFNALIRLHGMSCLSKYLHLLQRLLLPSYSISTKYRYLSTLLLKIWPLSKPR